MAEKDFVVKKGLVVSEDIELGHATDTTIARASSGVISVEGSNVIMASNDVSALTDSTSAAIGIGTIELGHANDTTIARSASGAITVEGTAVLLAGAQTGITTDYSTSKKIGRDADNLIDFTTDNQVTFRVSANDGVVFKASGEIEATSLDISGDVDIDGTLETDNLTVGGAQGSDGQVLTSTGSGVAWENAAGGGASAIGSLDDVMMDATNFVDGILIQPNSDGSAPTTGTLDNATENVGIGKNAISYLTSGDYNVVVGPDAGQRVTSGGYNVLIGRETGQYLGASGSNVHVGDNAGRFNTGANNTFVGANAGKRGTSGSTTNNTFVGNSAGLNNTGGNNTIVGHQALAYGTGCADNVVMGYLAAQDITGDDVVAIGSEAAKELTSGDQNVIIGSGALDTGVQTGNDNVAIGYQACRNTTSMSNSVFIGSGALKTGVATGADNVGIGFGSAANITSGARNIAIGSNSMDAATTDSDNIAIGYDALGGDVSGGEKNIAIGSYAGDAITSADKSVLIGYDAGTATTTAFATVGIGHEALKSNEYGSQNVAVGNEALENINNHFNVAVGSQAFQTSTAGVGNTVVGHTAGKSCGANASYNAFFGYRAGDGMDGNYNTAVGTDAMKAGASASGADNTAIGMAALEILTTGSTNIAIGHDAGNNITTGSNNVVIGAADVTADADDQLKISSGDGSPVWIEGNSAGVVLGALTPMFYERSDLDTNAYDFRVPTVQSSSANPNLYPMPYAGTVLAASFAFSGGTISTTGNSNTIRVRKNGGSSGGDIQDFTFDEGDLTNTNGTNYTLVKTGLTFTFSAGDVLQVKRTAGATDLNRGQAILWVKYNL